MNSRVFAEQMDKSILWRVVRQNTITNERYIVQDRLQEQEARDFAISMQRAADKDQDSQPSS